MAPALALVALLGAGCAGDEPVADPADGNPPATSAPVATTPDEPDPAADETAVPEEPTPTGDGDTPSPTSSSPDPGEPPFPANTEDDTAEGGGDLVTVTDIRVGRHVDFDRVVLDVGGDGRAGWTVGYVDEARAQGSGERVTLAGDAVLQVDLTHTGYPGDTGVAAYDGPRRLDGAEVVTEVAWQGIFEGHTQAFVGLTSEQPFRVFRVGERVVLDVHHEDVS